MKILNVKESLYNFGKFLDLDEQFHKINARRDLIEVVRNNNEKYYYNGDFCEEKCIKKNKKLQKTFKCLRCTV